MTPISAYIKQVRYNLEMTQRDLAKNLNVNFRELMKWETDREMIPQEKLNEIHLLYELKKANGEIFYMN